MLARVAFLFGASATLLSCSSMAQPNTFLPRPSPEQLAALTDCINSNPGASETRCIGLVSTRCMDSAATFDAKAQCVLDETFVWNELILNERPQLLERLPNSVREEVLEREAATEKASQARCSLLGTVAPVDAARAKFEARKCYMQSVALQWLWLLSLRRLVGEQK